MVISPITVEMVNLNIMAIPLDHATFNERGAIHVIFDMDSSGSFTVLDVGESSDNGSDPMNTPSRRAEWLRRSKTQNVWVGTYLEPAERLFSTARNAAEDRTKLVEKIRREYLVH